MKRILCVAGLVCALLSGCLGQCAAIGGGSLGAKGGPATLNVCGASAYPACPNGDTCRIAVLGDSQSADWAGYDTWPELLKETLGANLRAPCVVLENYAQSGHTTTLQLARWTDNVSGKGFDIVITWVGNNDGDADLAAANLATMHSGSAGEGAKVINLGAFPYKNAQGWTEAGQADTDSLMSQVSADPNCDYLDAFSTLEDPAGSDLLRASFDHGDKIHFNQAGHQAIHDLVVAELTP